MIRSPVQPTSREELWQWVRQRPDSIERGLRVVAERVDLSGGALGPAEALLRDAQGGAVLLLVGVGADPLLVARVLASHAFLVRNAVALVRALPEAELRGGDRFRMIVLGDRLDLQLVGQLQRLALPELQILLAEAFEVAGQERLVLRDAGVASPRGSLPADAVPDSARQQWDRIVALLQRLDPGVQLDGDRFSRRASLRGRSLCEFWIADDQVVAAPVPGDARVLASATDLRCFGDQVLRRYLAIVGGMPAAESRNGPAGRAAVHAQPSQDAVAPQSDSGCHGDVGGQGRLLEGIEALRVGASASRLLREEYAALAQRNPAMPKSSAG